MWFGVTDQHVFAIAGFWRQVGDQRYFPMVTCDANTGRWRRYTRKR
jgi:hypothetical protein